MRDLTAFQRDLLFIIKSLGDPYGLEIKREAEDYYETEITHGRLYPNLDTLVDEGFVHKAERDKRTNTYTATGTASTALESRHEWENSRLEA